MVLSEVLGMHVAEDAFGSDIEAFWSMPLSLVVAKPAAVLLTLSIARSITWEASGVELGLAFVSALADLSEEEPLGGGRAVPTPPEGGFMEKESSEKPEVPSFDTVCTKD